MADGTNQKIASQNLGFTWSGGVCVRRHRAQRERDNLSGADRDFASTDAARAAVRMPAPRPASARQRPAPDTTRYPRPQPTAPGSHRASLATAGTANLIDDWLVRRPAARPETRQLLPERAPEVRPIRRVVSGLVLTPQSSPNVAGIRPAARPEHERIFRVRPQRSARRLR